MHLLNNAGNYIDLHAHILPDLDDGPSCLEESVTMARQLWEQGFKIVVATPHFVDGQPDMREVWEKYKLLQNELIRHDISLQVLPGLEISLEPNLVLRLKNKELLTVGGESSSLLLELPMTQPLPHYLDTLVFELQALGYRVIIAHPERTQAFQENPGDLFQLVRRGVLCQITLSSLTGLFGKVARETAIKIVEHNLAHFFITDAHGADARLSATREAVKIIRKFWGEETEQRLLKLNPIYLLGDDPVLTDNPRLPQKKRQRMKKILSFFKNT